MNCVFRVWECIKRSSGVRARMWCHGRLLLHAGVILSSCLAASRYLENDPDAGTRDGRECSKRFVSVFGICASNDVFVSPSHLLDPFAIAMGAVLLMDAPSIVLAHTRTVEAVKAASTAALALAGGMATVDVCVWRARVRVGPTLGVHAAPPAHGRGATRHALVRGRVPVRPVQPRGDPVHHGVCSVRRPPRGGCPGTPEGYRSCAGSRATCAGSCARSQYCRFCSTRSATWWGCAFRDDPSFIPSH